MIVIQERLAGQSFDGTAGQGLVDWASLAAGQLPVPGDANVRIMIFSLSVESDSAILTPFLRFQRPGEAITGLSRFTLRQLTSSPAPGLAFVGCRIPVPRETAAPHTSWPLVLTTGVLAGNTRLVLDISLGGAPQGEP